MFLCFCGEEEREDGRREERAVVVMVEEEEWGRRRKMKKGHIPSYLIIRLQIISQRHDHTSGPSKQPAVVSNLRNSPKQKANFFSAFINVQVFERFFERINKSELKTNSTWQQQIQKRPFESHERPNWTTALRREDTLLAWRQPIAYLYNHWNWVLKVWNTRQTNLTFSFSFCQIDKQDQSVPTL